MDSTGAYKDEVEAAEAQFQPIYAKFMKEDIATVAADPDATRIGQEPVPELLRAVPWLGCAGAKVSQPERQRLALRRRPRKPSRPPSPTAARQSCRRGAPSSATEGVKEVANYVLSLSRQHARRCAGCRGKEKFATLRRLPRRRGKGIQAIGSANLTDKVWLYGGSEARSSRPSPKGATASCPP